jgi:hypothetical protein
MLPTDWNRQVLMMLNLVVTLATLLVLVACLRRTFSSTKLAIAVAVPVAALLFSLGHVDAWIHPYHLAFHTSALGAAITTWGLLVTAASGWGLAAAIAGAVLASLSFLAGLVAWPAFLPAVFLSGRRRTLIWLGAALAVIVPYSIGFPTDTAADRNPALLTTLSYLPVYLGAPFSADATTAAWIAIAGFLLLVANLALYLRFGGSLTLVAPWGGLLLFAQGNALLTALGRGMDTGQALAPRYQPISVLWWIAIVVVAALAIQQVIHVRSATAEAGPATLRWGVIAVNGVALLLGTAALVATSVAELRQTDDWLDVRWLNRACPLAYAYATDDCLRVYTGDANVQLARDVLPYMQQQRLALFSGANWLDPTRLPEIDRTAEAAIASVSAGTGRGNRAVATTPAPGTIKDRSRRVRDVLPAGTAVEVNGWASDAASGQPVGGVLLTIDDSHYLWATYGLTARGTPHGAGPAADDTGFSLTIPADTLSPGTHSLRLLLLTPDLEGLYREGPNQQVQIEVGEK